MSLLLAIVAFMNVPAAVGTLRLSDSARVAVRSGLAPRGDEVGFDNLLRLDVSFAWPTTELFVGYGPRLGLADDLERSDDPLQVTFLHEADAGVTISGARYRLTFRQGFSIGEQSFGQVFPVSDTAAATPPGAAPAPGAGPAVGAPGAPATPDTPAAPGAGGPVPLQSSVDVWSASTTGALNYLWSERWVSSFDAGYGTTGGNGLVAEQFYPRLQTIDVGTALVHDLTRVHRIGGELRGQRGWSDRSDYWLATLLGTFEILFTAETDLSLGAGVGYRDTLEQNIMTRTQALVPVGSAALTHEHAWLGARARYVFSLAYQPTVDTLNAQLQDRLTAQASASLATTSNSITLALSGSQSFPPNDPEASRFIGISLALTQQFADWIGAELGGQLADQSVGQAQEGDLIEDDGTVWTVYLGLGAQLDPVRF